MKLKSITANVRESLVEPIKIAAVRDGASVRQWAGEAIEARLAEHRRALRAGVKLPKGKRP